MTLALQLLVGIAVGYLAASFLESIGHEYVSHAPNRFRLFWKRYPRLFSPLLRSYFSHQIIHHTRTYRKDHVTQFTSDEERVRVDVLLAKHGRHGELIKRTQYANKLRGGGSILTFVGPLVAVWPLIYLALGKWAAIGAFISLSGPPILSIWIHPFLHMPYDEARRQAPAWISWILGTPYGRAMIRNHFLHHRHGNCCYNLLLGADYIRGRSRNPTADDISEMKRIGMPSTT